MGVFLPATARRATAGQTGVVVGESDSAACGGQAVTTALDIDYLA